MGRYEFYYKYQNYFYAFIAIIGLVTIGLGLKHNLESNTIEKSRAMTEGKVIEKHYSTRHRLFSNYNVSYQYIIEKNGKQHIFKNLSYVPYSTFSSVEPGQTINVYYATTQPDISELTSGELKQTALRIYLTAAAMLGFLIMMVIVDSVRDALGLGPIK